MKRLIKTVELSFFEDDANGEWGLCHKDTQDGDYGSAFNAFWGAMGLFHDIFEHSHEHQNKYFRGDYAMNVGGEMAAMGAMWYYYETLGMYNRLNNRSIHNPSDIMRMSTEDMLHEGITSGNIQFGHTLESNVPKQRPTDNNELEYQIEKYWKNIQGFRPEDSEQEKEYKDGETLKESISFRKIADLHRYGYRMAERMVPDNHDNCVTLIDFFQVWENFCQANKAETMANMFRGITFKIYKENDRISWKATLHAMDRFTSKDVTLTAENIARFSMEDAYVYDENY